MRFGRLSGETGVIRYPSVNCIGLCRLTAGSILFSRSLLNSKASSTRNGFNNMSLWPHKMTQALWEASRFTRRRPRGTALLWDERRWSCCRREGTLQGRGSEGLCAGLRFFFGSCAEKSSFSSFWLDSGALRFWPLGVESPGRSAEANLALWSWCSMCFFAFSSYLQSSTESFSLDSSSRAVPEVLWKCKLLEKCVFVAVCCCLLILCSNVVFLNYLLSEMFWCWVRKDRW